MIRDLASHVMEDGLLENLENVRGAHEISIRYLTVTGESKQGNSAVTYNQDPLCNNKVDVNLNASDIVKTGIAGADISEFQRNSVSLTDEIVSLAEKPIATGNDIVSVTDDPFSIADDTVSIATDRVIASDCTKDNNLPPNYVKLIHLEDEFFSEDLTISKCAKEVATITDLCSSDNIPEVEIISLIEERIPQYHLRADDCSGYYNNSDWVQTPVLGPSTELDLSPDQIDETLKYFVLCADRLTQMTKTYHDVKAVTKLLEEKEHDLELAARIGQILLEKNRDIQEHNQHLEEQVAAANEKVSQLRYEVGLRDDLLRVYDEGQEVIDSGSCSPGHPNIRDVNVNELQKKVQNLQDDNLQLKLETVQLQAATKTLEDKEEKLMNDTVKQLYEVNEQLEVISDELVKKTDDNLRQKEKITSLLSNIVDMQKKDRSMTVENMELSKHLQSAKNHQQKLNNEISTLQDRYDELLQLFESSQQDLRSHHTSPRVIQHHYLSPPMSRGVTCDSLASELDASLRADSEYMQESILHNQRVFETVRAAKASQRSRTRGTPANRLSVSSGCPSMPVSAQGSEYPSDADDFISEGISSDHDSTIGDGSSRRGSLTIESPMSGVSGRSLRGYVNPEKLQIVKPMEGSLILRQWQQLARPHLGRIFDVHPGVNIRGEKKLDVSEETVYSISDIEEDDDPSIISRSHDDTSAIDTMIDTLSCRSSIHSPTPNRRVTPPAQMSQITPQSNIYTHPRSRDRPQPNSEGYASNYTSPTNLFRDISPLSDVRVASQIDISTNRFSTPLNSKVQHSRTLRTPDSSYSRTSFSSSQSDGSYLGNETLQGGVLSVSSSASASNRRPLSLTSSLPGSNSALSKIKSESRSKTKRGLTTIFHDGKDGAAGVWCRSQSTSSAKAQTSSDANLEAANLQTCHRSGDARSFATMKGGEVELNDVDTSSSVPNLLARSASVASTVCTATSESPCSGASRIFNRLRSLSFFNTRTKRDTKRSATENIHESLGTSSAVSLSNFSFSVPNLTDFKQIFTADTQSNSVETKSP